MASMKRDFYNGVVQNSEQTFTFKHFWTDNFNNINL